MQRFIITMKPTLRHFKLVNDPTEKWRSKARKLRIRRERILKQRLHMAT